MSPAGLARPGPGPPTSDEPLSSSEQVSGTHAVIHAEAQVRLLSLAPGGLHRGELPAYPAQIWQA
jgi:hypothetical protein